jgi:DNA-binding response OmpR family regulator
MKRHLQGAAVAAGKEPRRRHVLIVEDEVWPSIVLEEALTRTGWTVLAASTIGAALDLATNEDLDAALLDINLGGDRVYPVAYVLRDRGVPFAFMTAYHSSMLPLELGRMPILVKPYICGDAVRLVEKLASGES